MVAGGRMAVVIVDAIGFLETLEWRGMESLSMIQNCSAGR